MPGRRWMDGAADVAETTYIPFQSTRPVRLIESVRRFVVLRRVEADRLMSARVSDVRVLQILHFRHYPGSASIPTIGEG